MDNEINVNEIVVRDNPRKDFSGLDELTLSIKEKGILEPLWVNKKKELIAGERRLRAAKALGFEKVPVRIIEVENNEDVFELKLIENMQRKDLNPVEEATAFKEYMDSTGHGIEHLAKKLGKKEDYIERRLMLLNACKQVRKALVEKKIELGHAVLLSRMEEGGQTDRMTEIIEGGMSVKDFAEMIEYDGESMCLGDAPFDKKECNCCLSNGGSQAILTEAGAVLKDRCMKKSCFTKKIAEWVNSESEALKAKGINVISMEKVGELKAREINSWEDNYKKIAKMLDKKPDLYAVSFDSRYMPPQRKIFRIKSLKDTIKDLPEKDQEAIEKRLNLSRREKLQCKVEDFKRDFLINKCTELAKPGSVQVKALILRDLVDRYGMNDEVSKLFNVTDLTVYNKDDVKRIFDADDRKLDKGLQIMVQDLLGLDNDALEVAGDAFGVDLEKHFEISKEFLDLYTKEQMQTLAKEMGVNVAGLEKKQDLIEAFLTPEAKKATKGKVPKILIRKR